MIVNNCNNKYNLKEQKKFKKMRRGFKDMKIEQEEIKYINKKTMNTDGMDG